MQNTFTAIESYERSEYPQFAALYDTDDILEVGGLAVGRSVRNDYGVPGSPVWYDIEDIEIHEYEINGVTYTHKELISAYDIELAEALHEICVEAAEKRDDWE